MLSFRRSKKLRLLFGILVVALILYKPTLRIYHGRYTPQRKSINTFSRVRPPVDCVLLVKGDEAEQRRAEEYQKDHPKKAASDEEYINMTIDCDKFVETRGYFTEPSSEEEKNFPLAFDILVYTDIELFERLLRAVYRPQNIYCVHVDKKVNSTFHIAVNEIAGCFYNVFVLKNNIEITWGEYSVLNAEILCMEALLKYKKWKYFINLTGQEFPLRTNWELVQILKVLNGTNLIGGSINAKSPWRFDGRPPPPFNVTPIIGPTHIVAKREFVEYAINNENGQQLLNWSKLVGIPDEIFFSTLNHNPQLGVPGSYLGEPQNDPIRYPEIHRYKIWESNDASCHGEYVNSLCIYLRRRRPAFAGSHSTLYRQQIPPGLPTSDSRLPGRARLQQNARRIVGQSRLQYVLLSEPRCR